MRDQRARVARIRAGRTAKADEVAAVLFADTVVARCLRFVARHTVVAMADLMRKYHIRAERPDRFDDGGTPMPPSRSSFSCQFGRYVDNGWIARVATKKSRPSFGYRSNVRCDVHWKADDVVDLVRALSAPALGRAFERIEYQMCNPRRTDIESETTYWLDLLRTEVARRSNI